MVELYHDQPDGPQVLITATTGEGTSPTQQAGKALYLFFRRASLSSKLLLPAINPSRRRGAPRFILKYQTLPAVPSRWSDKLEPLDDAVVATEASAYVQRLIATTLMNRLYLYYTGTVLQKLKVCSTAKLPFGVVSFARLCSNCTMTLRRSPNTSKKTLGVQTFTKKSAFLHQKFNRFAREDQFLAWMTMIPTLQPNVVMATPGGAQKTSTSWLFLLVTTGRLCTPRLWLCLPG